MVIIVSFGCSFNYLGYDFKSKERGVEAYYGMCKICSMRKTAGQTLLIKVAEQIELKLKEESSEVYQINYYQRKWR